MLAAVKDDGGPLAGMRPEMGEDGSVARWVFEGGAVTRADDGSWFLDWEGRRYVGESPEEVAAQLERGPADLGEMQASEPDEDLELPRERPEPGAYRDRMAEKFRESLERPVDPEAARPPADEWDEFLDRTVAGEVAEPPSSPPPPTAGRMDRELEEFGRAIHEAEQVDAARWISGPCGSWTWGAGVAGEPAEDRPGADAAGPLGNRLKEFTNIGVPEDALATRRVPGAGEADERGEVAGGAHWGALGLQGGAGVRS